jgi:hypothetical protein
MREMALSWTDAAIGIYGGTAAPIRAACDLFAKTAIAGNLQDITDR